MAGFAAPDPRTSAEHRLRQRGGLYVVDGPERLRPAATTRTSLGPPAALAALGLISAGIYLYFFVLPYNIPKLYDHLIDIGRATDYSHQAAAAYVAAIAALFILYLAGLWIVRQVEPRLALLVVGAQAVVSGLSLVLMYPIWATDIYIYALYGRVWVHYGQNPMLVPLSTFMGDPFLQYGGGWEHRVSAYGPLWVMVSGLFQKIAGANILDNLLLFKLTALLSYLGCVALVAVVLGRLRPGSRAFGTLFVAANPMLLLEVVGHGHNDATMTLFVLGAAALALTRYRALSLPAISLAVLTKYTLGVLGPLFVVHLLQRKARWTERLRDVAVGSAISAVALVAAFWPFWAGMDTFLGVKADSKIVFGSAEAAILCQSGHGILPPLTQDTVQHGLLALFAAVYAVQIVLLLRNPRYLYLAAFEVAFWLVLVLPHYQSWYLVWPIALAALAGSAQALWRVGVFSFLSLLGVYMYGYYWVWQARMPGGMNACQIQAVATPIILLPPLAVTAAFAAASAYRRVHAR